MIFDSMAACQAEGVSMCDAHPDLEVFRLRLGKALNYEFNEDSQTGLFQRRDPREGKQLEHFPRFLLILIVFKEDRLLILSEVNDFAPPEVH